MPSGHTHDRITWVCLPGIALSAYLLSQRWETAGLVSASFLFSGLMFGPDLDIRSKQYRRWGCLRWIWLPYQRSIPHRSWLSHGVIIGTLGRVSYLLLWIVAAVGISAIAIATLQGHTWNHYLTEPPIPKPTVAPIAWTFAGLELGALSHYSSDWLGSQFKSLGRSRRRN